MGRFNYGHGIVKASEKATDGTIRATSGVEIEDHGLDYLKVTPANAGDRMKVADDAARVTKFAAGKLAPKAVPALAKVAGVTGKFVAPLTIAQAAYDGAKLAIDPQKQMDEYMEAHENAGDGLRGAAHRAGMALSQLPTTAVVAGKLYGEAAKVTGQNFMSELNNAVAERNTRNPEQNYALMLPYQRNQLAQKEQQKQDKIRRMVELQKQNNKNQVVSPPSQPQPDSNSKMVASK